ncbi:hypothetical protein BH24ACT10_BH24ACT10_02110 [soil metagenome]
MPYTEVPDLLPVLSRGKHRNPRKGACFMELASFLAGERWSDHPSCTHPLLAEVARQVNDRTSEAGRSRLAPLIPDVIGLTTEDPLADVRIALHCALTALPDVAFDAQRSLAVGVLACERQLVALEDPHLAAVRRRIARSLDDVPQAGRWAAAFTVRRSLEPQRTSVKHFCRHGAPGIVRIAARSVAVAAIPSPDERLRTMLAGAVAECRTHAEVQAPPAVPTRAWQRAVALTR